MDQTNLTTQADHSEAQPTAPEAVESVGQAIDLLGASVTRLKRSQEIKVRTRSMNSRRDILPTTQFLASSALGAAATILALMVTVLSLSQSLEKGFEKSQFQRISQIALLCAILLVSATILLLILNVPLKESDQLETWYSFVYYFVVTYSSLMGGL